MQSLTWFTPILPGKTDTWLEFNAQLHGPRAQEHAASRRRMGMVREVVSLQRRLDGDYIVIFNEAEDLAKAYHVLATSADPFDVWFRDGLIDFAGMSMYMFLGAPPAVLRADWSFG